MLTILEIATAPGEGMIDITDLVIAQLERSGIVDGLCALIVPLLVAQQLVPDVFC